MYAMYIDSDRLTAFCLTISKTISKTIYRKKCVRNKWKIFHSDEYVMSYASVKLKMHPEMGVYLSCKVPVIVVQFNEQWSVLQNISTDAYPCMGRAVL
jgi:hypothetical protein